MKTITLPDPQHKATSPFHTYCVAVGPGFLDHTPVLDWYSQELTSLMEGREYYCATLLKFIEVKFGIVAALADSPEKAFSIKIPLLGTYGNIASWATEIRPASLADFREYFLERLTSILRNRHNPTQLSPREKCMRFDLMKQSKVTKLTLLP